MLHVFLLDFFFFPEGGGGGGGGSTAHALDFVIKGLQSPKVWTLSSVRSIIFERESGMLEARVTHVTCLDPAASGLNCSGNWGKLDVVVFSFLGGEDGEGLGKAWGEVHR